MRPAHQLEFFKRLNRRNKLGLNFGQLQSWACLDQGELEKVDLITNLNRDYLSLKLRIKNTSGSPIKIFSSIVADFEVTMKYPRLMVLENGWQQASFAGYKSIGKTTHRPRVFLKRDINPLSFQKKYGYPGKCLVNEWFSQILNPLNNESMVIGAVTTKRMFSQIFIKKISSKSIKIRIACQHDEELLPPGKTTESEEIVLVFGEKEPALKKFALLVAKKADLKKFKDPPKGICCSWYTGAGNQVDEQMVLRELRFLKRHKKDIPIDFIQIDEGYSPWGDWLDVRRRFPHGMKWLVEEINKSGFKAGIWLSPFTANKKTNIFHQHQDWFLKDNRGRIFEARFSTPLDRFTPFSFNALDPTHPEFERHLRYVIRTMVKEWRFELLKLDFLFPVCLFNNFYQLGVTRVQALSRGLEIIRQEAGNKVFIISSISPLSPLVGLVDAARVGLDIASPFLYKIPALRGVNRLTFKNAIRNIRARSFLHGNVWLNDSDCLICHQRIGLSDKEIINFRDTIKKNKGPIFLGDSLPSLGENRVQKFIYPLFIE